MPIGACAARIPAGLCARPRELASLPILTCERLSRAAKVHSGSDLFSAGVVLYQLLAGHVPCEGDTLISVAYKITKTDPPSLDKVRGDLPLSLRRVIERALKKHPDKRFQSGEEFAQALVGVSRE